MGFPEDVVKIGARVNREVADMNEVLLKILSLLGPDYEKYYD